MCINTLAGIARQDTAPAAARVAAISQLLDRGWGRTGEHSQVNVALAVQIKAIEHSIVEPLSVQPDCNALIEHKQDQ
jgi:hypothetical protein